MLNTLWMHCAVEKLNKARVPNYSRFCILNCFPLPVRIIPVVEWARCRYLQLHWTASRFRYLKSHWLITRFMYQKVFNRGQGHLKWYVRIMLKSISLWESPLIYLDDINLFNLILAGQSPKRVEKVKSSCCIPFVFGLVCRSLTVWKNAFLLPNPTPQQNALLNTFSHARFRNGRVSIVVYLNLYIIISLWFRCPTLKLLSFDFLLCYSTLFKITRFINVFEMISEQNLLVDCCTL